MNFGCWMRSPCPPKSNINVAMVGIHGNLYIHSNGNPEMQSHTVHNLNSVGFLLY